MSLIDKLAMPEKHIPFGHYCYHNNRKQPCPFWDTKPGEYPVQEDGYCHYMNISDWELNEQSSGRIVYVVGDDQSIIGQPISELLEEEKIDPISGKLIHFTSSLIWDKVKECEINMKEPDETVIIQYDSETDEKIETTVGQLKGKK